MPTHIPDPDPSHFKTNELQDPDDLSERNAVEQAESYDRATDPTTEWIAENDPVRLNADATIEALLPLKDAINAYLNNQGRGGIWADTGTQRPERVYGPMTQAALIWAQQNDIRALSEHVQPVTKTRLDGSVWELPVAEQRKPAHARRWVMVVPPTGPAPQDLDNPFIAALARMDAAVIPPAMAQATAVGATFVPAQIPAF